METKKVKNDLVSIIIPVYNAERFIEDTIKTVQEQTYTDWELILVNDYSTDGSKEIIKKFLSDNRISLINLEKNSGVAIARNTGIKSATGDYICFLDADDLWNKQKLQKQVNFMIQKKCPFSFTGYEFADETGRPNGKKVYVPEQLNYNQALKNTTISTITVMFNMHILTKEQIYMPNVKGEDTATWWKVLKQGYDVDKNSAILNFYELFIDKKNQLYFLKQYWKKILMLDF